MKTCATMGQATGTAAAYAVRHNLDPIELKDHPEAIWSIQQQLLRDDAYIIGVYNSDPRDHARQASVTASSEWSNATAENVISGQSRAVVSTTVDVTIGHGGGVPASQAKVGTQRWVSSSLPASITLALAQPAAVKQVQLVFDTGMHRTLSFAVTETTNSPDYYWGPQPETVKDYVIEGQTADGKWRTLCNVSGNYQRRRIHTLPCPTSPVPGPPPPQKPVVAAGSVSAVYCNVTSPAQRWTIHPTKLPQESGMHTLLQHCTEYMTPNVRTRQQRYVCANDRCSKHSKCRRNALPRFRRKHKRLRRPRKFRRCTIVQAERSHELAVVRSCWRVAVATCSHT
jgi:hypothetical protein